MNDVRIGRYTFGPRVLRGGDVDRPGKGEAAEFWGVYVDDDERRLHVGDALDVESAFTFAARLHDLDTGQIQRRPPRLA